ncbi:hypothetical protein F511_37282 [Dorcoceras hygrometricum]|uniref:Uncharacterized protein n=1 Tax=Dorcoceras hygrometricum TaxID=472368 RepID=A0A2Z7ATB6_9LAMI|nr:hypothetical protein F511_37282 [Dorcoceras hygrometricum]
MTWRISCGRCKHDTVCIMWPVRAYHMPVVADVARWSRTPGVLASSGRNNVPPDLCAPVTHSAALVAAGEAVLPPRVLPRPDLGDPTGFRANTCRYTSMLPVYGRWGAVSQISIYVNDTCSELDENHMALAQIIVKDTLEDLMNTVLMQTPDHTSLTSMNSWQLHKLPCRRSCWFTTLEIFSNDFESTSVTDSIK